MNQIEIEKTDNFWIDNGIVGLYKILKSLFWDEKIPFSCSIHLESNKLVISFDSSEYETEDLITLLNSAKKDVVRHYLKQTDGAGWIYKDGHFEIYQKNDFKMHLKPFFTGKTPSTEGALLIPDTKDSELGGKGRRMSDEEYQEFMKFKEENSPVVINNKNVALTGKGFLNSPPKYEIGDEFSLDFIDKGKKQCLFSGKFYKKADVITGMNFPFLTGKSGELNFVSQLEAKPYISSLYSFVSLFAFYNLNYLLQDDLKNYFVLYDGDLKKLDSFYNTIQKNISELTKPDFCSFETEIIGTVYESESLFNFLLSVYKQIRNKLKEDEYNNVLFSKSVFTLSNDGNIFRDVKEYTSISDLFDLFDSFTKPQDEDDENNYLESFINFIRFFSKRLDSGKYDTTWRNRLCSDILSFRSVHKTIEWFMGEVSLKSESGRIPYLDVIIKIFNNKTQWNMDAKMVETCKSIGNRIGAYCREKEDKGILFSIRNAKNRTEFLNVLAETQFRTEVSYGESFFKELPDDFQWEEYKALVSIFAMNSFLFREKKQSIN
jgi:hypothetical protein